MQPCRCACQRCLLPPWHSRTFCTCFQGAHASCAGCGWVITCCWCWWLQATGGRARPGAVQYQPRDMSAAERQQHLASSHFHAFLQNIEARWVPACLPARVLPQQATEPSQSTRAVYAMSHAAACHIALCHLLLIAQHAIAMTTPSSCRATLRCTLTSLHLPPAAASWRCCRTRSRTS